jgi:hypothetical protein
MTSRRASHSRLSVEESLFLVRIKHELIPFLARTGSSPEMNAQSLVGFLEGLQIRVRQHI